jgi:hypothetical protein
MFQKPRSLEKEHIPTNELSIRRGAGVEATDGYVGRVDEFLIDPQNDLITHLSTSRVSPMEKKIVSFPVGQIDHYKDNSVFLKLNKQVIEALPTIPIWHGSGKKMK